MKAVYLGCLLVVLAAAAGAADEAPIYLCPFPTPYRTIEAQTDEEYKIGNLATVSGHWQPGGTTAGFITLGRINEPADDKNGVLAAPPIDIRYFYLDAWPPEADPQGPGPWARAQGLIADAGLYAYGFIVRPSSLTPFAPPAFDETTARTFLEQRGKEIRHIKLDRITSEVHHNLNKGYKIKADPAAAAFAVEQVDFAKGLIVIRARLERLPPADSDQLFRYLDLYLIMDSQTNDVKWAVACVGGEFLE